MGPLIENEFFEVTLTWRWKNYSQRARMRTYTSKYLVRGYACLSEQQVSELGFVIARGVVESLASENAVTRLASKFDTEADDNFGGFADVTVQAADSWYELARIQS